MEKFPFTFENVPLALKYITEKLELLEQKFDSFQCEKKEIVNEWMNVKQLCAYLPSHPAEQTVYGWTSGHHIPFHKKGKSIMFRTSEIEEWLSSGERRKSENELEAEALAFINSKKKK